MTAASTAAAELTRAIDLSTALLIGRLVFRDVGSSSVFPVAGFAGNAFRFAFIGYFLIEVIDDPRNQSVFLGMIRFA